MRLLIIGVFALALCWGVGRFVNTSATAFHLAQVPISWTMLIFVGGSVLVASRVK
jgi:hypothetical protein